MPARYRYERTRGLATQLQLDRNRCVMRHITPSMEREVYNQLCNHRHYGDEDDGDDDIDDDDDSTGALREMNSSFMSE